MSFWQRQSIKKQFLSLSLIFLLTLALLLVSINIYMIWQTDQTHRDNMTATIDQMNIRLSVYADHLNRLTLSLAYDPIIQDFLASETPVEWFENRQLLSRRLSQALDMEDGLRSIIVIPREGNPVISGKQVAFRDLDSLKKPPGNTVYFSGIHNFVGVFLPGSGIYSTTELFPSHVASLRSFSIQPGARINTELGIIYFLLDGQRIDRSLGISTTEEDTAYYVIDRNGRVVYSNKTPSGLPFEKINHEQFVQNSVRIIDIDEKSFYAYQTFNSDIDMYLLSLMPVRNAFKAIGRVIILELTVFTILFMIALVILIFFKRSAVQPLLTMADYFRQITDKQGKREQRLVLEENMEVKQLASRFNQMLDSLDQLNQQLLDAELYKKQSEIAMLRSQINPHFLYNTLETIKGMSYDSGCADISDMISALGRVFRYSVKAPEFVQLSQELDILKNYLSIQKIRFPNRFQVEMRIDPAIEQVNFPKMLLQPIVENAIQHGLEQMKTGGLLTIEARKCEDILQITVSDNGCGFDPVTLKNMFSEMKDQTSIQGNKDAVKIGIANVHGRIRHYYGKPYGLDIINRASGGVSVIMRLPISGVNNV